MSTATLGNIIESPPSSQAAVYSNLMEGVDAIAEEAFSDRVDVLQESANMRMQQMESAQAKSNDALMEEMRQCQAKVRALEEERPQMLLTIRTLQNRLEAAERAFQQGTWQAPGVPPMSTDDAVLPPGVRAPPPPPGLGGQELFGPAQPPPGLSLGAPPPAGAVARAQLMAAAAAAAACYPLVPSFPHLASPLRKGSGHAAPESPPMRPSRAPGPMPPSSPPGLEPTAPASPPPDSCPLPPAAARGPNGAEEVPIGLRSPVPRSQTLQAPLTPQPVATPQRARNATPGPDSRGVPGTPPRTPQQLLRTPQRTPRPSPGFGTPFGLKSPMVPASPFVHCEGGACIFGFTLRLASGVEVGLDIAFDEGEKVLHVKGIVPGGAVEAWNRQCVGGPAAGKAVTPGDKVARVNSATDIPGMLKEFKEQTLLRFTVVRGDPDAAVDLSSVWSSGAQHARGSRTRLSVGSTASPATGQDSSPGPTSVAVPSSPLNPNACEFKP